MARGRQIARFIIRRSPYLRFYESDFLATRFFPDCELAALRLRVVASVLIIVISRMELFSYSRAESLREIVETKILMYVLVYISQIYFYIIYLCDYDNKCKQ